MAADANAKTTATETLQTVLSQIDMIVSFLNCVGVNEALVMNQDRDVG
jgi:hypothetical protein